MKRTLKRILGWALLGQILPFVFLMISLQDIGHKDYEAWVPIAAGYTFDLVLCFAWGFIALVSWCFDTEKY